MNNIKINVAIAGAAGRMGKQLIQAALQMSQINISAAFERKDSPLLGIDIGELIKTDKTGIIIQSNLEIIESCFDVLIDFTCPEGTLGNLELCSQLGKGMVIGTTGFNETNKKIIQETATKIPIVFSVNFSVYVNVMIKLLEKITKVIGKYSDIEIIEMHHRHKIDSPSGTALEMGKVIANTLNKDLESCTVIHTYRGHGKRIPGSIGFNVIRIGNVIGEHTAIFANLNEHLEITHKALNRMTFANGAIKAALWLKDKSIGIFNMIDVLNMNDFD